MSQRRLTTLINRFEKAKALAEDKPTEKNIKAASTAKTRLDDYKRTLEAENDQVSFESLASVHHYLELHNWKVSKSTLYTHKEKGLISADKGGRFPLERVENYAKAHLEKKDGDEQGSSGADAKARAEAERIEEQTKRLKLQNAILNKEHVSLEKVNTSNAAKAALLTSSFRNWCHTEAEEIAATFGIPKGKVPDLIQHLQSSTQKFFDTYADDTEFLVEVLSDD